MDRRDFLKAAGATAGGLGLLGWHCGSSLRARSRLEDQLVGEADPILTRKALGELRELPATGRDEIRTWFHGPCLNAREFAVAVTSEAFRERTARCASVEEQQLQFLLAFDSHVVSAEAVLDRVRLVARDLGSELDLNWEACCREVSRRWNVHVRDYGSAMPDDFAASLEPMIRASIDGSLQLAHAAGQRPALSETTGKIAESALLLLPLARVPAAAPVVVPLFLLVSVEHLFSYFAGLRDQGRSTDHIRRAVSARLALLGNRVGDEFEAEMRSAVSRLHEWQHQALRTAAGVRADESIPVLWT